MEPWYHVVPRGTTWYHVVPRGTTVGTTVGTTWYYVVPSGTKWYHVVPLKKNFFFSFYFLFFFIETIKANKTLIFVRENVGALLKSI
jgi:hypothetical protein